MRLLVIVITASLQMSAGQQPEVIGFDRAIPGKLPQGWAVAMTHAGAPPRWESVRDESAPSPPNVFAQLSQDQTAGRFPLAIWTGASLQDGVVSVAFKAVNGSIDRAAGIVWRYQDPNNYYIVRANALENNVVLYKVENGIRASIAPKGLPSRSYGVKHQIPSDRWNHLEIHFNGAIFTVFLNQERLFEAQDMTFEKPGKVGLWTKADSVTYFDDFTISGQRRPLK
ncbi:MAG TPA: family 16 glycoside hydrolase [Edaphobacter sp.]|nr:family 16 glycoside hydrolase [Edaphobacter sp.]